MTAEEAAWAALDDALQDYEPPCDGNELFTADGLGESARAECAALCARCLVSDLCEAFADAANVKCGFWAGHQYGNYGRRKAHPVPSAEAALPPSAPASASSALQDDQPDAPDE